MTRLASALVLIAVLVVTLWWLPTWATLALAAIVALLAGSELAGFAGRAAASVPAGFVAVLAAVVALAFALDAGGWRGALLVGVALPTAAIAIGAVALAAGPPEGALTRAGILGLAPIYIGVPLGALAAVQGVEGPAVVTLLFVIVATSDSAQYYTGRAFGRRRLAPAVSPGKTVEGAVGGLAAAAIVGALVAPPLLAGAVAVSWAVGGVLGVGLAAVGLVGDLFESLLKRSVGVKDSSTLIPGHGGVLDRVDSYLFAAPAYFVFLRYLA